MGSLNIKKIRKLRRMTQKDLANAIGVDFSVISRYESGKISPPVDRLEAIAQALNVDTDMLLGTTSVDLDAHDIETKIAFRSTDRYYLRRSYLSKLIVEQVNGTCDLCEKQPFLGLHNGERLLETHYLQELSKGGEDLPENIAVLCPNCHKRVHTLNLPEDIEKLKIKAKEREEFF